MGLERVKMMIGTGYLKRSTRKTTSVLWVIYKFILSERCDKGEEEEKEDEKGGGTNPGMPLAKPIMDSLTGELERVGTWPLDGWGDAWWILIEIEPPEQTSVNPDTTGKNEKKDEKERKAYVSGLGMAVPTWTLWPVALPALDMA